MCGDLDFAANANPPWRSVWNPRASLAGMVEDLVEGRSSAPVMEESEALKFALSVERWSLETLVQINLMVQPGTSPRWIVKMQATAAGLTTEGEYCERPFLDCRFIQAVLKEAVVKLNRYLDEAKELRGGDRREYLMALFKVCAWFIPVFIKIHPFTDGHHRTASILAAAIMKPALGFNMQVVYTRGPRYYMMISLAEAYNDDGAVDYPRSLTMAPPSSYCAYLVESAWSKELQPSKLVNAVRRIIFAAGEIQRRCCSIM